MRKNSCQLLVFSYQINIVFIVCCFLLCAVLQLGCAKREVRNIDSKGTNIICFGDSITFGYGADSREDYPSVLAAMTEFPVVNAGIDGDTSTEAVKRITADVLDRDPLLVVVEFGGNDFLRKIPQEVTINNIKEMTDRIHAIGAMVAIVDVSAGIFLKDYRQAFAEIAQEKNAIFIPGILSAIITNPSLKSDFIHPNANGYKLIAQRVYRAILPHLNRNAMIKKFGK